MSSESASAGIFANGWSAAQARAAMLLDPHVANLNTGSYGPLPRRVFERAVELRTRLAEEPMDFFVRKYPPLLWQARTRLAQFLGPDEKSSFASALTNALQAAKRGPVYNH